MTSSAKQRVVRCLMFVSVWAALSAPASFGQSVVLPDDYSCSICHRKAGELWNENTPVADETRLADDIHWQNGLRCHDCHGGAPVLTEFKNHRDDPTFRSLRSRATGFCGHCIQHRNYAAIRPLRWTRRRSTGPADMVVRQQRDANSEADKAATVLIYEHGIGGQNASSLPIPLHSPNVRPLSRRPDDHGQPHL
jgi:hypothetical protein